MEEDNIENGFIKKHFDPTVMKFRNITDHLRKDIESEISNTLISESNEEDSDFDLKEHNIVDNTDFIDSSSSFKMDYDFDKHEKTVPVISEMKDNDLPDFDIEIEEIDNRLVIGEPSGSFYQKAYGLSVQNSPSGFRSDYIADNYQYSNSQLLAASVKGAMHKVGTSPRQDSYAFSTTTIENEQIIFIAISDGVSAAKWSHVLADSLTKKSLNLLKKQITETNTINTVDFAKEINDFANEYCCTRIQRTSPEFTEENYSPAIGANYFAATLECMVIRVEEKSANLTQFTIAGDGGAYVFKPNGDIVILKSGKMRDSGFVSNKVSALPILRVENPIIVERRLEKGDVAFITTDGISDFIGDGKTQLSKFLSKKFQSVNYPTEFLRIIDASMYQFDDDKTGVMFRYGGI